MKKLFTTLSILLICQLNFAQKSFTEAEFRRQSDAFVKDPVSFLKNGASPEMLFVLGSGQTVTTQNLIDLYQNSRIEKARKVDNLKIQQFGNTAIATGTIEQISSTRLHPDQSTIYKGVFTYILSLINNEWVMVAGQHTDLLPSKETDEVAIKSVISQETQAYIDGDIDKLASYWSGRPSDESQSQSLNAFIGQPYAKAETSQKLITQAKATVKKMDVTVEREDYEMRLNKDMAWVTFTQKVIANGIVVKTDREARILERINGVWKIVFVGNQAVK